MLNEHVLEYANVNVTVLVHVLVRQEPPLR
jgi:hypothetical protein